MTPSVTRQVSAHHPANPLSTARPPTQKYELSVLPSVQPPARACPQSNTVRRYEHIVYVSSLQAPSYCLISLFVVVEGEGHECRCDVSLRVRARKGVINTECRTGHALLRNVCPTGVPTRSRPIPVTTLMTSSARNRRSKRPPLSHLRR